MGQSPGALLYYHLIRVREWASLDSVFPSGKWHSCTKYFLTFSVLKFCVAGENLVCRAELLGYKLFEKRNRVLLFEELK